MVKRLDRLGIHFAHNIIMQVNVGMETGSDIFTRGYVGEMFWVLRGSTFHQKSGECHDLQRK